ncbi:helix-turn-helix domain-containing protein [Enterococcus sp. BWR-S5]|uniref:helix-turn-helix domain-containing protein n=1 Tax=Enterococcus sp. BWR-S5 TaxID=2787714 RepID=UPI00192206AA|nr:helix-turn-helix transcriptional regulator [Enterococcus sp. BWR-S5]MBL1225719.1 helix-turn-helix transcriptional regulator [Enterococcus sp. BWR-S5]
MNNLTGEKLYDLKAVGKRIREIRGDYTLEDFGFLADRTSKAAVYNWENGKSLPNKERLKIIALLGKTTVEWVLYGNLDEYISSLFLVGSKPYENMKAFYMKLGYKKELFKLYEVTTPDAKQSIIDKVIEKAKQNEWSYSETHHITDLFLNIADNVLERNQHTENLPLDIKELLSTIEKQNLTDDEIDSLLTIVRNHFKS